MAFGDVDGDGYTDFLSSSANSEGPNDENTDHENDVYVIFGRPRSEIDSVYAVDKPGGADIVCYMGGYAMACEDIDNDGYDDMILAETPEGVHVIFGAPRDQLRTIYNFKSGRSDYTPPDILIKGSTHLGGAIHDVTNALYDNASRALVSGDINDDGFADIIVGSHFAANRPGGRIGISGATYIVFGRPRNEFPPVVDVDYTSSLPHPDVVIRGESGDRYPFTLAIGDLDGDGVDDLLASTFWGWGEYNITPGIGEIHGWWGKRKWKDTYYIQINEFDFALQGTPNHYNPGYRLETADLDGDGRDELVIGSAVGYRAIHPADRSSMGEYRIIFGRPRSLWPKWEEAVTMTDVLILGAETLDAFTSNGPSVWAVCFSLTTGNHDGDAYDDLLIGSGFVRRPDDSTRPGAAYLLRGRPRSEWDPFIDLRDGYDTILRGVDFTGSPGFQHDRFGFVTAMGDLDGNGLDELFVAAPFADGPDNSSSDCGEISIFFDSGDGTSTAVNQWKSPSANAALLPNHPNPFSQLTTFVLSAPAGETVSLTIYDVLGREVARPLAPVRIGDAQMEVSWAGLDRRGVELPTGVYFAKLTAGQEAHSRKILIVR